MPKATEAQGASNVAQTSPRRVINETDTDRYLEGNLTVTGSLTVVGTSTTGPAASTEGDYVQIIADTSAITIDTLNLDAVPSLSLVVPSLSRPVYLDARLSVSHTVINANVICGFGLQSATIVTQLLGVAFTNLAAIGTKGTMAPMVRLPAASPGTYQLFICGDAGNATVRAAAYYPSFVTYRTV